MQKILQIIDIKSFFVKDESLYQEALKAFHDFGDGLITLLEKPESKSEVSARIRFLTD